MTKTMSHLEDKMAEQLDLAKIPYEKEVSVIPGRRFRWDFRVGGPSKRVLVEVQGAVFVRGGHSTGVGITRDALKSNLAVLAGWKPIVVTAAHIKSGEALQWIQQALAQ